MKHEQVLTSALSTHGSWAPAGEPLRSTISLTSQQKTAAVTRVRWLERELFDSDGQVRRRVSCERAQAIVDELNRLRVSLGWLEVDLAGRWRWP
jgi:hypothetical protein